MDYYSVDSILAEEAKVEVRFKYTINNFGFYINSLLRDIRPSTRVCLPYFLVAFLLKYRHCTMTNRHLALVKHDLDADAALVNLGNSHFMALNSNFEDTDYMLRILYERLSAFARLIVKLDFSEDDLALLCHSERMYMRESRANFRRFQNYYMKRVQY
ncbi:hypothetical protein PAPHI01_0497 [Pancytospora philotis]|nr:hypothetical protein PAPHI01_0497 [Pancytospora philotis]